MRVNPNFELVNMADDYILVPIGEQMESFNGTVVLNEVSSFIFERLEKDQTEEKLVNSLMDEFEVDSNTARTDVHKALSEMRKLGIIYE